MTEHSFDIHNKGPSMVFPQEFKNITKGIYHIFFPSSLRPIYTQCIRGYFSISSLAFLKAFVIKYSNSIGYFTTLQS